MSGFPATSLAQQFSLFQSYYTLDENGQPIIQPSAFLQSGGIPSFAQHTADALVSGLESTQGSSRSRRRAGGEHVKFRRTRSGCYTCRSRRVKCDEGRPICERCKKGNRDCLYPESTTATKARRGNAKDKSAQDEDSSDESLNGAELDQEILLMSSVSASTDHDFSTASPVSDTSTPMLPQQPGSRELSIDVQAADSIPYPSVSRTNSIPATPRTMSAEVFSKLPEDIQFYISYARTNMTAYHWNYLPDGSDFQRTALIEAAIRYEPLLYAVTCFAAYHHTLRRPDGKMEHFLNYHSKSVLCLSKALKKAQGRTLATLLTILQLATIEEALGDWVNLMSHQKAAYQILTDLYTPVTIMEHPTLRNVFKWYLHFDTYVGMLSGAPQIISRDWLEAQHEWYKKESQKSPENIVLQYEKSTSGVKLMSFDIFHLFSKANSGALSEAEASEQLAHFQGALDNFEQNIPACLANPKNLVTDFTGAPPRDPVDLVDPYEPNVIYGGENFPTNQHILGTLGLKNVFEARMAALTGMPRTDNTASTLIRRAIKVISAVKRYPDAPEGALLSYRAVFSLVAFMIPAREKEVMWMRTIFAAVESSGYIYSESIRSRLQSHWNVDLSHWWLPDDNNVPPVIRYVRDFTAERSQLHKDDKSSSLREMRGIFNTLSLTDGSSPESVNSPDAASNPRPPSEQRSPSET